METLKVIDINPDGAKKLAQKLHRKKDEIEMIRKSYVMEKGEVDADERTIVARVSTPDRDRDGEIVEPKGIDITHFNANPVLLWAHKYDAPPIGRAVWTRTDDKGLLAKFQFANTQFADEIYGLYRDGFLKTFSIGFIPVDFDSIEKIHKKISLLEVSAVPVPSNPNAKVEAMQKGLITCEQLKKDMGIEEADKGGEGSGNYGHEGRPGEVGGSGPGGGGGGGGDGDSGGGGGGGWNSVDTAGPVSDKLKDRGARIRPVEGVKGEYDVSFEKDTSIEMSRPVLEIEEMPEASTDPHSLRYIRGWSVDSYDPGAAKELGKDGTFVVKPGGDTVRQSMRLTHNITEGSGESRRTFVFRITTQHQFKTKTEAKKHLKEKYNTTPEDLIYTSDKKDMDVIDIEDKAEIITKPETTDNYHRIPVSDGHDRHRIRTITVSAEKGIKALYCGTCKEIATYLFDVDKWTMAEARAWVNEHKDYQPDEAETKEAPDVQALFDHVNERLDGLTQTLEALKPLLTPAPVIVPALDITIDPPPDVLTIEPSPAPAPKQALHDLNPDEIEAAITAGVARLNMTKQINEGIALALDKLRGRVR